MEARLKWSAWRHRIKARGQSGMGKEEKMGEEQRMEGGGQGMGWKKEKKERKCKMLVYKGHRRENGSRKSTLS